MTETIYQVLTPAGAFQIVFGDDETPITEYRGDGLAIQFFKDWLLLNQVSGQDGWRISADSLDPSDLYGFCQPPGSGITVMPPFEDFISYVLDDQPDEQEPEDMTTAILDAATGREALQLAKELKQIRAGIAELTGRAALTAAKRIREIRQVLGVSTIKQEKPLFVKKWPLTVDQARDQGLIDSFYHDREKKTMWRVGNDSINFSSGGEALDYYFEVVKPRDDENENAANANINDGKKQIAISGDAYAAFKDGDTAHYVKPGSDHIESMLLRSFRMDLVVKNDIDVVWMNSMDDLAYIAESNKSDDKTQQTTIADVNAVMPLIKQFIGKSQLAAMGAGVRGEEGQFFKDKFVEVAKVIEGMPKTYETDGQGDKAIAYLHYFKGAGDWYITEKDSDPDGEGQAQAFGYADLGQGGELGYISIQELIGAGVELDLYWSPKSIGEIKGNGDPEPEPGKDGLSNVQKMKDAVISHGGEVLQELSDSAVSFMLHGGEFYGNQPPYLRVNESGRFAVVYTVDDVPVFMSFEEDAFTAVSNYVDLYEANKKGESMTDTDQQKPLKSAFIAELEGLKVETDIEAYNNRLDDIAARVEAAGLMDELDADLNAAADVLTDLLAAAENK